MMDGAVQEDVSALLRFDFESLILKADFFVESIFILC